MPVSRAYSHPAKSVYPNYFCIQKHTQPGRQASKSTCSASELTAAVCWLRYVAVLLVASVCFWQWIQQRQQQHTVISKRCYKGKLTTKIKKHYRVLPSSSSTKIEGNDDGADVVAVAAAVDRPVQPKLKNIYRAE